MLIQVLGSGCQTCHKLYSLTVQAVKELGLSDTVKYVTGDRGIQTIIAMGVMQSPVLAIDGKPVLIGYTSNIEAIKDIIKKQAK